MGIFLILEDFFGLLLCVAHDRNFDNGSKEMTYT